MSLYLPIRNGMNWQHWCLYVQNLLSLYLFLFQGDITDARKNYHNDSETNPLLVPLTYIAGKKATHLGDSDTTPKSCLDVVSKLLANSNDTSSMKSAWICLTSSVSNSSKKTCFSSTPTRTRSNLYGRLTKSTGHLLMLCRVGGYKRQTSAVSSACSAACATAAVWPNLS